MKLDFGLRPVGSHPVIARTGVSRLTGAVAALTMICAAAEAAPLTGQEARPQRPTSVVGANGPAGSVADRATGPATAAADAGLTGAVAEADSVYWSGQPREAFEILDAYLAERPADYQALWRAARSAVVLGIAEEGSRAQNAWLDPAIDLSSRAVSVDPVGLDGLYWRGVSHGRRAMNANSDYALELTGVVYDDANAILAVDPMHAGAHNMLGKLYYEIMSLSRFKRGFAKAFMSTPALEAASWEGAEEHLTTAVEVSPDYILFQFDLGELHRKRDRRSEAIEAYARVMALPVIHPTDLELRERAWAQLWEWDAVTPDGRLRDSVGTSGTDPGALDRPLAIRFGGAPTVR